MVANISGKPGSFAGAGRGALLTLPSMPRWEGSTGSIIAGCWNRSATFRRQSWNKRIIANWKS